MLGVNGVSIEAIRGCGGGVAEARGKGASSRRLRLDASPANWANEEDSDTLTGTAFSPP